MGHLSNKDISDLEYRLKELQDNRVHEIKKNLELDIKDLNEYKRLVEKQNQNKNLTMIEKFSLNQFQQSYKSLKEVKEIQNQIDVYNRYLKDIANRLATDKPKNPVQQNPIQQKPLQPNQHNPQVQYTPPKIPDLKAELEKNKALKANGGKPKDTPKNPANPMNLTPNPVGIIPKPINVKQNPVNAPANKPNNIAVNVNNTPVNGNNTPVNIKDKTPVNSPNNTPKITPPKTPEKKQDQDKDKDKDKPIPKKLQINLNLFNQFANGNNPFANENNQNGQNRAQIENKEQKIKLDLGRNLGDGHVKQKANNLGLVFLNPAQVNERNQKLLAQQQIAQRSQLHHLVNAVDLADPVNQCLYAAEKLNEIASRFSESKELTKLSRKNDGFKLRFSVIRDEHGQDYTLYKKLGFGGTAVVKLVQKNNVAANNSNQAKIKPYTFRACKIFICYIVGYNQQNFDLKQASESMVRLQNHGCRAYVEGVGPVWERFFFDNEVNMLTRIGQTISTATTRKFVSSFKSQETNEVLTFSNGMNVMREKKYIFFDLEPGNCLLGYLHPEAALRYGVNVIRDPNKLFLIAKMFLLDLKKRFHDNNIVHGDIKPENIIFDEKTNSLKLIDVTMSIYLGSAKYSSLIYKLFTPSYAAPELYDDNRFSKASDIYAAGNTLAAILITTLSADTVYEFKALHAAMTHENPDMRIDVDTAISQLDVLEGNVRKARNSPF